MSVQSVLFLEVIDNIFEDKLQKGRTGHGVTDRGTDASTIAQTHCSSAHSCRAQTVHCSRYEMTCCRQTKLFTIFANDV